MGHVPVVPGLAFWVLLYKSALSCTWNLPVAVKVTCTGFKCSRWTKEFEEHKAFWLKRESMTPLPWLNPPAADTGL